MLRCAALRCRGRAAAQAQGRDEWVQKASRDPASARGGQREQSEREANIQKNRARVDAFTHGSEQGKGKPWTSLDEQHHESSPALLYLPTAPPASRAITTYNHDDDHLVPCHAESAVPCKRRDRETDEPCCDSVLATISAPSSCQRRQDSRLAKGACIYIPARYYYYRVAKYRSASLTAAICRASSHLPLHALLALLIQRASISMLALSVLLAHIGNTTRTCESSRGQRKILGAGGASTLRDNFPISHNILDPSVPPSRQPMPNY